MFGKGGGPYMGRLENPLDTMITSQFHIQTGKQNHYVPCIMDTKILSCNVFVIFCTRKLNLTVFFKLVC